MKLADALPALGILAISILVSHSAQATTTMWPDAANNAQFETTTALDSGPDPLVIDDEYDFKAVQDFYGVVLARILQSPFDPNRTDTLTLSLYESMSGALDLLGTTTTTFYGSALGAPMESGHVYVATITGTLPQGSSRGQRYEVSLEAHAYVPIPGSLGLLFTGLTCLGFMCYSRMRGAVATWE